MKAKSRLPFLDRVFLWINCALCFALLLSYLAPVVDPRKFWIIAFFGLAYPMLLLANLILLVYWIFRGKAYLLIPLLTIALGWRVLSNNIGFNTSDNDKPLGSGVRIMTYNVHNFKKYGSNNDIPTKHEILQVINDQQPDIIGFQEFYTRRKGQFNMRDSICGIMHTRYYCLDSMFYNQTEIIGMAIFSKLPIIDHGFIRLADQGSSNQCVYVDVNKNGKLFRLYSVHLQSVGFDPEDYRYLNNVSEKGKPNLSSTKRLGSKLKSAFLKRSEQVEIIKRHAATCPYPYIISGDFNDTPASYAVNQMSKGLKNAFKEKGFGFVRTYNGAFPNFQIDYILSSPQFEIANYKVVEKKLSDHYPVRSDVKLRE